MKVCVIIPFYHPYAHGGVESYTLELARRLRERGHEVSVVTRGERDARIADDGNGDIYQIRMMAFRAFLEVSRRPWDRVLMHMDEIFSDHGARAARRIINEIKPDVVFSQGFYGFGRSMPGMLAGLGIPWLHYVHSYGLVCKRQSAMDRHGCACVDQCADCKVICAFKQGPAPLREAITIYNSEHMRKFYEEAGVTSRESHVIDPVLSYGAPEIRNRYKPGMPIRLMYVGRVSEEKGIRLLCDSVAAEPGEYRLDVMGDGAMLSELKSLYASAPITFHGRVEPERRDMLLREGDALVAPSLWNEPFGRVIQEGFLAGLPVIAAGVGAMGGLVRDGVDGVVFGWRRGAEAECLADALKRAAPLLGRLRDGALETRARILEQDNFGLIEGLLTRAAERGAVAFEATGDTRR